MLIGPVQLKQYADGVLKEQLGINFTRIEVNNDKYPFRASANGTIYIPDDSVGIHEGRGRFGTMLHEGAHVKYRTPNNLFKEEIYKDIQQYAKRDDKSRLGGIRDLLNAMVDCIDEKCIRMEYRPAAELLGRQNQIALKHRATQIIAADPWEQFITFFMNRYLHVNYYEWSSQEHKDFGSILMSTQIYREVSYAWSHYQRLWLHVIDKKGQQQWCSHNRPWNLIIDVAKKIACDIWFLIPEDQNQGGKSLDGMGESPAVSEQFRDLTQGIDKFQQQNDLSDQQPMSGECDVVEHAKKPYFDLETAQKAEEVFSAAIPVLLNTRRSLSWTQYTNEGYTLEPSKLVNVFTDGNCLSIPTIDEGEHLNLANLIDASGSMSGKFAHVNAVVYSLCRQLRGHNAEVYNVRFSSKSDVHEIHWSRLPNQTGLGGATYASRGCEMCADWLESKELGNKVLMVWTDGGVAFKDRDPTMLAINRVIDMGGVVFMIGLGMSEQALTQGWRGGINYVVSDGYDLRHVVSRITEVMSYTL